MSETVPTVKVKPWSTDQGEYVEINESDFNAEVHERFEEPKAEPKTKRKAQASNDDARTA